MTLKSTNKKTSVTFCTFSDLRLKSGHKPPSEREQRREELGTLIEYHYDDSNGLYGSPKITQKLRQEGIIIAEKTVGRIMKQKGCAHELYGSLRFKPPTPITTCR